MRRAGMLALYVTSVLVVSMRPADAAFPGTNGLIAFQSPQGPDTLDSTKTDNELFSITSDGATLNQLTINGFADINPSWSPNGQKIAFASRVGPNNTDEIFIMDADGTDPVQLTTNSTADAEPAWSPSGKRILFSREVKGGTFDLFIMDAVDRDHDGRGDHVVRITKNDKNNVNPSWAPDGKRVAFARFFAAGNYEIMTMRPAPQGPRNRPRRLTKDDRASPHVDSSPNWSPDGTRIVFSTNRFDNGFDIAVVDRNGANLTQLTLNDPAVTDGSPVWSPDGTKIAFYTNREGNAEIYTMDANGANPANITNDSATEVNPSWQPLP